MEDAPGDGGQIKGQVFDGQGNRVGGEFTINSNSQNDQHSPAIAALSGGRFIVTWTDNSGVGSDNQDDAIRAQIFSVSSASWPGGDRYRGKPWRQRWLRSARALGFGHSGRRHEFADGLHSFTATAGNTSVDVTGWSIHGLSVVPAQGFVGDVTITVNATTTDHATLAPGVATDTKTVSQTITLTNISALATLTPSGPATSGGTGNDVLFGGSGNDVLTGGGGNDTYQFGHGGGQDRIVNGTAASTAPSGELDLGAGISANQLWFQRNGNDLSISVMGSHDQVTVGGWFSGAGSQLAGIKTADGMTIGAGVSQLVQAMAAYSSAHADFDPTRGGAGAQRSDPAEHPCGELARLSRVFATQTPRPPTRPRRFAFVQRKSLGCVRCGARTGGRPRAAPLQCTAAYMIFSSVASNAENSSTTLPCRETRMRSDSAMISGK